MRQVPVKPFQEPKIILNLPSRLARSHCHMEPFEKQKIEVYIFERANLSGFWYVEVHHQRRIKSTKTGISSKYKGLACPETKNFVFFLWGKVYIRNFCSPKARCVWFKNEYPSPLPLVWLL